MVTMNWPTPRTAHSIVRVLWALAGRLRFLDSFESILVCHVLSRACGILKTVIPLDLGFRMTSAPTCKPLLAPSTFSQIESIYKNDSVLLMRDELQQLKYLSVWRYICVCDFFERNCSFGVSRCGGLQIVIYLSQ